MEKKTLRQQSEQNQKKREFLENYQMLNRRIEQKIAERKRWQVLADQLNAGDLCFDREVNREQNAAKQKIRQLEDQLSGEIQALIQVREQIEQAVNEIKNKRFRLLLLYRYIDAMTWEKIAEQMDYSYQWVCQIHAQALEAFKLPPQNDPQRS